MATNPKIPGVPSNVTTTNVIMLIGIKILTEDSIIFSPYNITNATHNFLINFKRYTPLSNKSSLSILINGYINYLAIMHKNL